MISTVTLTFDLTYVDPLTGALAPRGIVTDSTDYAALNIDVAATEAKGVGVITFNGDVIVDLNDPSNNATTMINLQDWAFSPFAGETPFYAFALPLDSNGNVANGVYTLLYRLRLKGACDFVSITLPSTAIVDNGLFSAQYANFFEVGNELEMAPSLDPVVITSVGPESGGEFTITLSGLQNDTDTSATFDVTNTQLNAVYTYSGCVQSAAEVTFSYDCEYGTNGTWAVANSTVLNGQTITSLSATINYPAWTSLTPTFNSQIVTSSLPYSNNVLATGTFGVTLSQVIQKVQTDGLILKYISSGAQEFVVSCAGSLCGLIPCIESLRNAHATELQRNRISKYQVFVDNVLLYYAEAQNYRSCGDIENYRKTLALIEAQLDASGCECGCCDPDTYQWVNNNAASTIDSLINAIQFRLFDADPVGPGSPTAQNDETQGVQIGALWENVATQVIYICTDNEPNAATWEEYYGPGQVPTASEIPANPGNILTSGFVQGQLDQIDSLAVFDGINGLNKVGNDVRLGGALDSSTTIDCTSGVLKLTGGGLTLDIETLDGPASRMTVEQASATNVPGNLLIETTTTGGAGANGIGAAIWLRAQDALGAMATAGKIISTWVDAAIGNSNVQLTTKLGGTESVGFTLNPNGSVTLDKYDGTNQEGSVTHMLGVTGSGLVQKVVAPKISTYVAIINQTGTAIPVLTEIYNDTGLTITAARNGAGDYYLGTPGGFDAASTMVLISNGDIVTPTRTPCVVARIASNRVIIETKFADTLTLDDQVLTNAYIEVRIYE